jgi:peptidoglycan/LPS O-acetylase OafA/YrhL
MAMNLDRRNNFDQLRLLGAILVIYGHSYVLLGRAVPTFAANTVSTLGVKIFFCISGYLIAVSWLRDPHLLRFLARRSLRIFPALIVITLLSSFVLGPALTNMPLSRYFSEVGTYSYLNNIRLYITYHLPGVFEGTSPRLNTASPIPPAELAVVNGSLWSLPVEFVMYLILPALISFARLLNCTWAFAALTVAFTGAAFSLTTLWPQDRWLVYATNVWSVLQLGSYFVLSACIAVYRLDLKLNAYVAFMGLFALSFFEPGPIVKEGLLICVLPYVILYYGTGFAPFTRFLRGPDLSYGIFLYGFPVQQILIQFFGTHLSPWRLFAATLPFATACAWLSWHLIEARALMRKPVTPRSKEL